MQAVGTVRETTNSVSERFTASTAPRRVLPILPPRWLRRLRGTTPAGGPLDGGELQRTCHRVYALCVEAVPWPHRPGRVYFAFTRGSD
jgi:hypothetical protein